MAYKLEPTEDVRDEIVRCAREQLERAAEALTEGIREDRETAVHSARKAVKKDRSLLRLAHGTMPRAQRREDDAALRAAGRMLSETRDADVLTKTVDRLAERFAGQLPKSEFNVLRDQLASQSRTRTQPTQAIEAAEQLRAVRSRCEGWKLTRDGWQAIDDGLLRSYRRGRKALARARTSRSSPDLHAWRKRVKDLSYQERLLAPTCGPTVGGHADDAHRLAELLGDDHDLGMLRETLARESIDARVDVDVLGGLIDHRRAELQAEAFWIGNRVYAERPKQFRRRIRRCWKAGRALAQVPEDIRPAELAETTRALHVA